MKRVAELFEVVVFTASLDKYANPVLDLLERNVPRSVHHRLFREHCVLTNGALVKDITVSSLLRQHFCETGSGLVYVQAVAYQ